MSKPFSELTKSWPLRRRAKVKFLAWRLKRKSDILTDYTPMVFGVCNTDTRNLLCEFHSVWEAEECAARLREANPGLSYVVIDDFEGDEL